MGYRSIEEDQVLDFRYGHMAAGEEVRGVPASIRKNDKNVAGLFSGSSRFLIPRLKGWTKEHSIPEKMPAPRFMRSSGN
jgi:hypothetical protein